MVERTDPHRFLAGCRIRRLNQAPSVLPLSVGFFSVCCAVNYGPLCVVCSVLYVFVLCFGCSFLSCQYRCEWLTVKTPLWNDLWCVDGDVKLYLLTHSLTLVIVTWWIQTTLKVNQYVFVQCVDEGSYIISHVCYPSMTLSYPALRQTNQQHCRHNLLGSGDESTYVDAQYVKTLLLLLPGGY